MRRAVLAYGFSFSSAPRFRSGFFFSGARFGPSCKAQGHERCTLLVVRTRHAQRHKSQAQRKQPLLHHRVRYERHSTSRLLAAVLRR